MTTMDVKPGVRDFTADMFAAYQGHVFTFRCPDGHGATKDVELQLIEINRSGKPGAASGLREPFALLFRSVSGDTIPIVTSALPELMHPDFAVDLIFLSRVQLSVRPEAHEVYYEAVFN